MINLTNIDNKNSQNKRLVMILGMHRSGTSLITRGLKIFGVELGNNLMPPQESNPKGFYEDLDINALDMEMLKAIEMDWDDVAPIEKTHIEILKIKDSFCVRPAL